MKTPPPPPPILTKIPVSSDHPCRPKAPQPASDSFVRGLRYVPHAGPDSFGQGAWYVADIYTVIPCFLIYYYRIICEIQTFYLTLQAN